MKTPKKKDNGKLVSEDDDIEIPPAMDALNTSSHNEKPERVKSFNEDDHIELPPPMEPLDKPQIQPPGRLPTLSVTVNEMLLFMKNKQGADFLNLIDAEKKTELQPLSNLTELTDLQDRFAELCALANKDRSDEDFSNESQTEVDQVSQPESSTFSDMVGTKLCAEEKHIGENGPPIIDPEVIAIALQKRKYALTELVENERDYINHLKMIIDGYKQPLLHDETSLKITADLRHTLGRLIFSNIEQIYDFHKETVLPRFEDCLEHPERIPSIFLENRSTLIIYVTYCKNQPTAEHIITEFLNRHFENLLTNAEHRLQVKDLLIKPVQHMMHYNLLIEELLKYSEKAGLTEETEKLQKVAEKMNYFPKLVNDMMDVGRMQGFPGHLKTYGKLTLHGTLYCCEKTSSTMSNNYCPNKSVEFKSFLFEQAIVFAGKTLDKAQTVTFNYHKHLTLNKICMETRISGTNSTGGGVFCLKSLEPSDKDYAIYCRPLSPYERDSWITSIENNALQMRTSNATSLFQKLTSKNSTSRGDTIDNVNFSTIDDKTLLTNNPDDAANTN